MYEKDRETIRDKREMLRVKVKSLAEEARIIRREEQRTWGAFRAELHNHRVVQVRRAARWAHLAYGLIRGKTHDDMEPDRNTEPNWDEVNKLVKKYGSVAGSVAVDLVEQLAKKKDFKGLKSKAERALLVKAQKVVEQLLG